jgi:hypothetical protein
MPFFDPIRIGASGAAADYEVQRSLRFNDGDSTYLRKSDFGSPDSGTTFTFSAWVKRTELGTWTTIAGSHSGTNAFSVFGIDSNDRLIWRLRNSSSSDITRIQSENLLRDTNAWYHLLLERNSTLSTAGDRAKLYINGVRVTEFDQNNTDSENQTYTSDFLQDINIGRFQVGISSVYYGGMYLAEYHYVDGQALDPSYFTETDPITGQLIPKKYTGSYGTNGFYLNFSDNSGTTATTLGKDSSGNGNNFTPNNFSVAAGVGNDSVEDTPTNNFCTMNPLDTHRTNTTLAEGNLKYTHSSNNFAPGRGTFAVKTGKWYFEFTKGSGLVQAGFANTTHKIDYNGGDVGLNSSGSNPCGIAYDSRGIWYGYTGTNPSSIANDDIIGVAFDADNFKFYFHKNGTYYGSGDPSTDTNGIQPNASNTVTKTDDMLFAPYFNGANGNGTINFGQRPFSYTIPTGYQTLCSANLPDPTILLPNKHFDTLLYSGTGSSNSITGLDFAPNWTWIKSRSLSSTHKLMDSVRGDGLTLASNNTNAEASDSSIFSSLDSSGFTVTGTANSTNASSATYVAWNWNAGDTDGKTYAVTVVSDSGNKYRFDGFGTSAVTLDLAEGGTYVFDWSDSSAQGHPIRFSTTSDGTHGGGSEYTTGVTKDDSAYKTTITVAASAPTLYYYCQNHSGMGGAINTNSTLGSSNFDGAIQSTVKANLSAGFSIGKFTGTGSSNTVGTGLIDVQAVILKNRGTASTNWVFYHDIVDGSYDYMYLNTTAANASSALSHTLGNTFKVGSNNDTNASSANYIFYAFSEVSSYSKFGSYTGNGNADGTFVFTGFRPAWVMIKRTDSSDHWNISDAKRDDFNEIDEALYANLSNAEGYNTVFDKIDYLSNGFKIRANNSQTNASGGTYIYLAFAESPFKNARAR